MDKFKSFEKNPERYNDLIEQYYPDNDEDSEEGTHHLDPTTHLKLQIGPGPVSTEPLATVSGGRSEE